MIKIIGIHIAEYAASSAQDGKTIIAGMFDNVNVRRRAGAPSDADPRIVFPSCYLVIQSEASLAGGLQRTLIVRIVDGSGNVVLEGIELAVNYALNRQGRIMRNNAFVRLEGLVLPGPDDYVIEIFEKGHPERIGDYVFYVTEATGS